MKNVHPLILLLIGSGMLLLGNSLAGDGSSGTMDIIGTALGLFGDLLILYSVWRGIQWIWKQFSK